MKLDSRSKKILLDAAWEVIGTGVATGIRPRLDASDYPTVLQDQGATFITLTRQSRLRGCCGTVEAHQSLITDVTQNAWRTAFDDPRFEPLSEKEYAGLKLEISLLSPLLQIKARDQGQLLSSLEPGRHGLLIRNGNAHATFLPKVWESLNDPEMFLQQLMVKAGMPLDSWPGKMEAFVYTAELFGKEQA